MRRRRLSFQPVHFVIAIGLAGAPAIDARAQTPCGGGTLNITATSDTPFTGSTFNVGQQTTLMAAVTAITPATYAWTIPGPHIKDYNDDLGTQASPALSAPLPWSVAPIVPSDLTASSVRLYWKPSAAQTHPNTGPPEPRIVSLSVTLAGGGTCTATRTLTIERNLADATKQPEDFYTSTHRAPTTTNQGFGHVVDEHIYWHQFVGGGPAGNWRQFLAWHGYFLQRFDQWRTEFGYDKVSAWYPGRPLPTGPAFDHPASLRLAFNADNNRIPTWFTITGSSTPRPGGTERKIADFASVNAFSNAFEGTYHGQVHCNIGPQGGGFFDTSGPFFGSMCMASSPKDPMFWRWHGFIDLLYRNFCTLRAIMCHSGPDPAADPWMADNAADEAAGGTVPSPAPRWLSPDVWNRRLPVTTDACLPRQPPPNLVTVGGVVRDCGSSADHENPVSGTTNYLYVTLRNTRPAAVSNAYAEVAIYIANASTGLTWPTDFTVLPESRQLITVRLDPNQVTDIGPLPWTPPSPSPSDHFCLYVRVVTVQEKPPTEGSDVDANVAGSNSIAWRNVKVVPAGSDTSSSSFLVRNIRAATERVGLTFDVPPALLQGGTVTLRLDATLVRALEGATPVLEGLTARGSGVYTLTAPRARLQGLQLTARQSGVARVDVAGSAAQRTEGDIIVTQTSAAGVDGGVVVRVANPVRR